MSCEGRGEEAWISDRDRSWYNIFLMAMLNSLPTTKETVLDFERLIGEAAKNQAAVNPERTVFNVKRLIRIKFDDKDVQKDMKLESYKIVNKVVNKSIVLMERGETSEENAAKTSKKPEQLEKTGKRIGELLLSHGFAVKAGVRDVEKTKTSFKDDPSLQADVTEGPEKLAEVIGDDYQAVICATGFCPGFDLFDPWKTDNFGMVNLVDMCRKQGVDRFVLISSILVNGAAMGQILNPAYIFLNVFGLTLVAKLQAEKYIKRSSTNYTIVRPHDLKNDAPAGNVVVEPEMQF
ncbi:unnamed protein product [Thlaspi arvense]|uniref:NAD(P)-binding domain-containing protein n=1 Tax=Thlaspi arvense TaxID=13288 RepID=A0AAU9RYP0_THLAR|nr:unnamed protein product [Thlaspi arvense]